MPVVVRCVWFPWQLVAGQNWECVKGWGGMWGNFSFSHPIIFQQGLRESYHLQNILQPKHAPQNILVTFFNSKVFAFLPFINGLYDHILNIVKLFAAIVGKDFYLIYFLLRIFSIIHSYSSRSLKSKDRKERLWFNIISWIEDEESWWTQEKVHGKLGKCQERKEWWQMSQMPLDSGPHAILGLWAEQHDFCRKKGCLTVVHTQKLWPWIKTLTSFNV